MMMMSNEEYPVELVDGCFSKEVSAQPALGLCCRHLLGGDWHTYRVIHRHRDRHTASQTHRHTDTETPPKRVVYEVNTCHVELKSILYIHYRVN